MNIKNLGKATKLYEEVRVLDAEIIEIDKMAMIVAEGETKSFFKLRIEDFIKKEEPVSSILDEDGSINADYFKKKIQKRLSPISFFGCSNEEKKPKPGTILKSKLSETVTMQILGILLCEKQSLRNNLLKRIEKLGVI